MAIHYLSPSWNNYSSLVQKLAAAILDQKIQVDEIVAISRGGLTLGRLLSDFLQTPISVISIQSYTDIQQQGVIKITGKLTSSIKNKRILLVDDVSETGKTFHRAMKYLKRFQPTSITTAVLYHKSHSTYRPDFFAVETTRWVLFPYEPTEMITLLTGKMQKEGKSKAEIQKFLERLGFSVNQIAFVRRHYIHTL
jgi:hypoxanthine phosphoribosyltransferase